MDQEAKRPEAAPVTEAEGEVNHETVELMFEEVAPLQGFLLDWRKEVDSKSVKFKLS